MKKSIILKMDIKTLIPKNELALQEINRIAKNPTQDEIDEGVNEIANEINNN